MSSTKGEVIEELTRPVIKFVLALVGLLILRFIVTRLPGLDTSIPDAPITFATVAGGIITLIMVAIIINFGREVEPRLVRAVNGPESVIADLAQATKFLVILVAIILAYDGLQSTIIPFLVPDPGTWVYDAVFLVVALVPTAIIAKAMFTNLEALTDMLTEQVKSVTVDEIACLECEEMVRASLEFCPNCGSEVPEEEPSVQQSMSIESTCPECGADVAGSASFCGSCGSNITGD